MQLQNINLIKLGKAPVYIRIGNRGFLEYVGRVF